MIKYSNGLNVPNANWLLVKALFFVPCLRILDVPVVRRILLSGQSVESYDPGGAAPGAGVRRSPSCYRLLFLLHPYLGMTSHLTHIHTHNSHLTTDVDICVLGLSVSASSAQV